MSLINDALKRASTQAQSHPAPTPQATPAGHVEVRGKSLLPLVLVVVLVGSLMAAGAFFWKWANATQATATIAVAQPVTAPVTAVQPAVEKVKPVVAAAPVAPTAEKVAAVPVPVPVAAPPAVAPTEQAKAETPTPNPDVPAAPETQTPGVEVAALPPVSLPVDTKPVVPTFPDLKLQGIFYNPANPAAVINRRTFSVGGMILGARITKIEQESVTVEWNGETRVLELTQ